VKYDVAILGAGAAGLAAAAELARRGMSALVLEARDRIGGRVWSLEVPGLPVPVELGAEFIHGRPEATFSRLRWAGIAAIDAPIFRMAGGAGQLRRRGDRLYDEVQRVLRRHAGALDRKDISFERFLAHVRRELSAEARVFARMRVQGYDAANPERASARAIAEEWCAEAAGSAGHFRVQGGYGALLDALAAGLHGSRVKLQLGSVVRAVRWKRGAVEVTYTKAEGGRQKAETSRIAARKAIVTLPLGVLKLPPRASGAVRFSPALKEKRRALDKLASGAVIKAALLFRTAFWEEIEMRAIAEFRSSTRRAERSRPIGPRSPSGHRSSSHGQAARTPRGSPTPRRRTSCARPRRGLPRFSTCEPAWRIGWPPPGSTTGSGIRSRVGPTAT
jgi:monoamine oxidase